MTNVPIQLAFAKLDIEMGTFSGLMVWEISSNRVFDRKDQSGFSEREIQNIVRNLFRWRWTSLKLVAAKSP